MPLNDTLAERTEFGCYLTAVAGVYGRDLSAEVMALYWNALRAFDLTAIREALDRHIKNPDSGMFMPKPADIFKMLGGTTTDQAAIAWAEVETAVRRIGSWDDVAFADVVAQRCVADLGGWIKLCETKADEMPFRAKEFQTLYRGYVMRRALVAAPEVLTGRLNLHNAPLGIPLHAPIRIGRATPAGAIAVQQLQGIQ